MGLAEREARIKKRKEEEEAKSVGKSNSTSSDREARINARKTVNDDYIKSFYEELKAFTSGAEKDYDSIDFGSDVNGLYDKYSSQSSALREKANLIKTYIDSSKDSMDEKTYTEWMDSLGQYDTFFGDINTAFEAKKKFYTEFPTQGYYDAYLMNNTEGVDGDSIKARKSAYDSVVARLAEIDKKIEGWETTTELDEDAWVDAMAKGDIMAARTAYKKVNQDEYDAIVAERDKLQAYVTQYERGKKNTDELYAQYSVNEDWAEASANRDFNRPKRTDLWLNATYKRDEYGNGTGERYDIDQSLLVMEDPLGTYLAYRNGEDGYGGGEFRAPEVLGDEGKEVQSYLDAYSHAIWDGEDGHWENLTEEEINLYYYMLSNGLKDQAVSYLSGMETELDRRATAEYQKELEDAGALEMVFHNVLSIPANIVGGASAFVDDAINLTMGKEINPYDGGHSIQNYAQGVRTVTANNINSLTGASEDDWLTWGDAYQGLMSGADSIAGAYVMGGGYTIVMGMGGAASEAKELYEKGASKDQIIAGSLLAGTAEAAFESISIGYFLDDVLGKPAKSIGQWLYKTLGMAGVEASEEFCTTIANYISDAAVRGDTSDWAELIEKYTKEGFSNGEAIWRAIKEVGGEALHDGVIGAISGGGMGAVGNTVSGLQYNRAVKDYGQQVIDAGGVDSLQNLALDMAGEQKGITNFADKVALRRYANKASKADTTTNRGKKAVGILADTVDSTRAKQNKADLTAELQKKGVSKAKAKQYADILFEMNEEYFAGKASNFTLGTNEQWQEITGDSNAYSVLRNIVTDEKSSVNVRNLAVGNAKRGIRVDKEGKLNETDVASYQKREYTKLIQAIAESKGIQQDIENDFDVSEDGKTYAHTDNGTVEVTSKEFINSEDGTLKVKINGAQEVDTSSVSYGNMGEALVVSAIVDMGVGAEDANALYKMFEGTNAKAGKTFANGISLAFKYGRYFYSPGKLNSIAGISKEQAKEAFRIGRESRSKDTKASQAKLDAAAEANAKEGKKAASKGSVVYEGVIADENGNLAAGEESLTDVQKASVNGLKLIAELSPLNFHVFQSEKDGDTYTYVKKNGEETHANGWYRVGTNDIYIDLNAGATGEGTVMYTAAHEISHFIKEYSPERWDKMAEYIMDEYCSHYGGAVDALLLKHIAAIQNRPDAKTKTQKEIEDEAFEDLVCDSLSKMLIDGTVVDAMANIKKKDKGVWNSIKKAVLNLLDKWGVVIDQYKDRNPDAEEAGYFRETSKAFKKLQSMMTEAFVDAGDTYSKVGNLNSKKSDVLSDRNTAEEGKAIKSLGKDSTVERNENGDMLVATNKDGSTVMYSERTWRMGGKEKFIATMTRLGHGDQAQEYAKYLDDALGYLRELAVGYEILGQHLDADIVTDIKNGKQVLSAIVNNGDYPVNIDLALICKKRVAYMRLMAKMIEDGVFGDVKYDGDAIAEVNKILRKNGFETACLGCFVESRRLQFQTWAETIVQEWNEAVEARNKYAHYFRFSDGKAALTDEEIDAIDKELSSGKKNAKGNLNLGQGSVATKMSRLLDKVPSLARKLTVDDLLTPQGLTALRATDANLFSLVKQRYGAASPKIVQDFNPYASEIADLTFNFVKKITGNNVKGAKEYILEAKKELGVAPAKQKSESKEDFKKRKAEYDAKVEALAMQKYLYSIGGARIQSFSDFMIENVFDYLQIFADLAAKELPMHGYTKEITALRLFGMSGAKWNGSLIAHVDKSMGKEYAGLLPAEEAKNGNGILVKVDGKDYCIGFDDFARNKSTNGESFIQSIGMKDIVALMYDPRYSPYVGNITIGVSDKQIMAMLDSPLFRMVIPYHASGMLPQFAQLVGVDMYNDYTNYQNTTVKSIRMLNDTDYTVKVGDNGKPKVVKNADGKDVGIDTHYAFNKMLQKYGDARKTCDDYLAWCRNEHPIYDGKKLIGYATFNAKFSDSPTGVDFTKHHNYYKLIEDFNTYDNITEKPTQQGAVTMNFPSAENRLTAEQKKVYEKALRDTGIFSEADIKKYLEKADMTFEEIVRAEVGNRKAYNDATEPKFNSTVKEVEDYLLNAKDDKGNYKFRRDSIADTASDYIEAKNHGISLKPATGSYMDEVKLADRTLPQDYVDNLLDGFGIANPGDWQQVQKRVMSTLVSEGFFTNKEERSRTDVNAESGMHIVTNKSGIDETFNLHNYTRIGMWRKVAKLATIRRLPEIIRDGHMVINNAPNMYGGTATNKAFAYIEHTLEEAGKSITVKLDIKKSPQKNKFWVHKAIEVKSVSGLPASTQVGTEAGQTTTDTEGTLTHSEPNVKDKLSDRTGINMESAIEQTKDLVAMHNLSPAELMNALTNGELVMPSLAITNKGLTRFGDLSLLFDKNTIDPKMSVDNKLYGADAWTPQAMNIKVNAVFDTDKTVSAVNRIKNTIGSKFSSELFNITAKQFRDTILKSNGSVIMPYAYNIGMQTAFAMENGYMKTIPTNKDGSVNTEQLWDDLGAVMDTDGAWRQYRQWMNKISDTIITSYDKASTNDMLDNMRRQTETTKPFKLSENGDMVVPVVKYHSIDELRQNKGRLSTDPREAHEAVAKEFMSWANGIAAKNGIELKNVVKAINKSFADRYYPAHIVSTFEQRGVDISRKDAVGLQSLFKKSLELPTEYFESKPHRKVGLEEVRAVVMPSQASYSEDLSALRSELEKAGIEVIEYEYGNKQSRIDAINSRDDVKFSQRVSAEQDAQYLDAVNRGDTDAVQKMVDDAAKNAGYTLAAYHGTRNDFTVFDRGRAGNNYKGWSKYGKGFYFAQTSDDAEYWAGKAKGLGTKRVISTYLRMDNPFVIDPAKYEAIEKMVGGMGNLADYVQENGYDSINAHGQYVVFDSNQIKSSDPIVYDEQGNVIPLSERFDSSNDDIRYQDRGNTSARALLANALESTIDSSTPEGQIELAKLKEYKEMANTLDELNVHLTNLRGKLFTKGLTGEERKKIQAEATKTANRISVYDKKLLTLEATKPIKRLLDREKAQAAKKQRAKDAENLAAYKETRAKSEERVKLQQLVLNTSKWIAYPKKGEVKCPDILRAPYADFLQGIDLSSKRLLNGGEQTRNDYRMATAMDSLATAIQRIKDSQNPAIESSDVLDSGYLDLPAFFVEQLREMAEKTKALMLEGEYVVNRMSSAEIKQLTKLIRTLNHSIKEMSTLYSNLRFANAEELGDDTISFMEDIGEVGSTNMVSDFVSWDNALPYYAFKRFGKGGESIFEELMDSQDKMAFLAKEIMDFREKAWNSKESKEWSEDTHTISLPSGNSITLTTADAMSIYCLARRDNGQGLNHLTGGGVRVLGEQKGAKKVKDSKVELDFEDVVAIGNSLNDRQIEVAEAIQEFMSTVCSEWGNEISMKRFLTKDFTEKRYFPIQSNDEVLAVKDPQAQQSDLYRLLNISATKPLTKGANNAVIVRNIFDVFTDHTSDMARLNAYGMALLDYMKWVNYNEKTKNEKGQISVRGVRGAMHDAYGDKAQAYVIGLIKDINGRANDNGDHPWLMKMTRSAKTAAVGSSLRVAALQFTSYPRAAMVLSPAVLAKGMSKRPQISKAKQYCGIALWKSFGFYDTNIARSIEDQIKGTTDWKQKAIELSLKGAEWGDAITWGYLWNACEYDVVSGDNQLKVGTEEFNQAVAKRLREVVYATQVVDSVLTRSSLMRNKSGLTQTATAFMSEPTVTHNILMDAGFQFSLEKRRTGSAKAAWKKCGGHVCKAVGLFGSSQVIVAVVESLIDAYRDDDDDEFVKKFGDAMLQNLVSDIIIFNKIPIISDMIDGVLSLLGVGYFSSDRLDMTWLTDTRKALESWLKVFGEVFGTKDTSITTYKALYDTVKALSSTTGVSFSGALREIITLWNNTAGAADPDLKVKKYED